MIRRNNGRTQLHLRVVVRCSVPGAGFGLSHSSPGRSGTARLACATGRNSAIILPCETIVKDRPASTSLRIEGKRLSASDRSIAAFGISQKCFAFIDRQGNVAVARVARLRAGFRPGPLAQGQWPAPELR